ncbi:arsenic metallochaperone ArsD family protein [Terrisporobacter glycolicus]|uniref:Arsenical resistance operon trans-acting repressor ArsD n=1 Tax=Terrisporobacter glycolicus ATCC 14880 = DSM 1288 TaxID=1121315 RepID=A0ABZ2ETX7_9FIRM|nr:arsenic metallochaperone ArsD family protein [Terrisporobacter glycolicus]
MKIEIYENKIQRISGLLNTNQDENIYEDLEALKKEISGIEVIRHNVITRPNVINSLMNINRKNQYITRNKVVNGLMNIDNKGSKILNYDRLPVVVIDKNVFKVGSYPTVDEIKSIIEANQINIVSGI